MMIYSFLQILLIKKYHSVLLAGWTDQRSDKFLDICLLSYYTAISWDLRLEAGQGLSGTPF